MDEALVDFDFGAFPKDFMWAAATSHHQAEGGDVHSDWWVWETSGRTKSGELSGDASDHWNRFEADLDLLAALNLDTYRMSLNWARLFPSADMTEPDPAAAEHYDQVFAACAARGIRPMVTLHHFCMPQWLTAQDRWADGRAIDDFARFARFAATRWGGSVDWWVTINEPDVYAFHGWLRGIFPPGKTDLPLSLLVRWNLMKAHAEAYHAIKEADTIDADGDGRASMVGLAQLIVPVQPFSATNPIESAVASYYGDISNAAWFVAVQTGLLDWGLPPPGLIVEAYPRLVGTLDFIGVNYYSRQIVRADLLGVGFPNPPGALLSELNIEIYPPGLYDTLELVSQFGLPIIITENGIADSTDELRGRYIVAHLAETARFMRDHPQTPVLGYVHWALMDNFEWENGFRPRFGLYAVDYATQQRTARPSAGFFAGLIARIKNPDPR